MLFTLKENYVPLTGCGHPSVATTRKTVKRAHNDHLRRDIKTTSHTIADECKVCKTNATKPRSFKLTVGLETLQLKHRVIVYTIFISSKPVNHVIYENTHLPASPFLKTQTATRMCK